MNTHPATQFNADPDQQHRGEIIIQHMKNWEAKKG
jgi:hypothetical protein